MTYSKVNIVQKVGETQLNTIRRIRETEMNYLRHIFEYFLLMSCLFG